MNIKKGGKSINQGYIHKCIPIITVITVVYNGESTLEKTILSVLDQSSNNIEYIIVDGCSTDRTLEIIKKYDEKIYYWVSETDQGLYDAMNKAISLAQGKLVGILNAGDTYTNNALNIIVDSYQQTGNSGIYTGDCQSFLNDRGQSIIYSGRCTLPDRTVPHPSTFVPLSIYKGHGLFDTSFKIAADYELLSRFYKNSVPFFHIPKLITVASPPGISGKYFAMWNECLIVRLRHHPSILKSLFISASELMKLVIKTLLQKVNLWHLIENRKSGTIY
jgi:glycosyltransferase involved in cell wall biosynthesis